MSTIQQIDRERSIPVLILPQFYCPDCKRLLEIDLSELSDDKIMLKGCGMCSPFEWYKLYLTDIQTGGLKLADKAWRR